MHKVTASTFLIIALCVIACGCNTYKSDPGRSLAQSSYNPDIIFTPNHKNYHPDNFISQLPTRNTWPRDRSQSDINTYQITRYHELFENRLDTSNPARPKRRLKQSISGERFNITVR